MVSSRARHFLRLRSLRSPRLRRLSPASSDLGGRRRGLRWRPIACLLCLLGLAPAAAAEEKEWTVAATPAFSLLRVGDRMAWGGGAGVDLGWGLTDAVTLRATGALTGQAVGSGDGQPSGAVLAWFAGVGVTYAIDIVRVVPYFDFALGYEGLRRPIAGGSATDHELGLEAGIGVDYLVSRRLAVGAVVRYHGALTAITELPLDLYVGPRIAIHFGGG